MFARVRTILVLKVKEYDKIYKSSKSEECVRFKFIKDQTFRMILKSNNIS